MSATSRVRSSRRAGRLALLGGGEWAEGVTVDRELLEPADRHVLVLPTAAAYERPERSVERADAWFRTLGTRSQGLMVLSRRDAEDESNAQAVRNSGFIYLGDGSPLHLRSVLKGSAVWHALFDAWEDGATVAGSSAGAMVLTDPMVDPRGGAFTLGLGLVEQIAVVPHHGAESAERMHRTLALAPRGLPVVGIPEQTALVREPDGSWRISGPGQVEIFVDGSITGLGSLPR